MLRAAANIWTAVHEAVFEAKFMLPWSFSEEIAAEKYMAQLQHNMWVTHLRSCVLSISNGSGHSAKSSQWTLERRGKFLEKLPLW